ncbi:zinc ribbon domain-containing protein [Vibrio ziniensis]|uniref:Zinc ribbon domain-containing protein n=1 Tax=Vibrio ziniensis TaxID=2711221 RepID=A0A6G7CH51_9VIBR|nr:zinc ribbon domain-containing protein [Vibrio ziniensis]QIH41432.1 zinc ribbon domain-containing protein [Vibrio ziniensis]
MLKYCTNCQTEFGENHKFCSGCGTPRNSSGHVIHSGEQSVNAIGSEINNSNIHIGDNINNSNNIDPELLNLKREFVNLPWTRDGALAKSSTFKKLGTWGSLASIIGLFMPFFTTSLSSIQPVVVLLFGIFFSMLILSMVLPRRRFEHLSGLKNLEIGTSGKIYITKIFAECPWCGSEMKLRMVGPKNQREHLLMCTRNPSQHKIIFDPTALPDIEK